MSTRFLITAFLTLILLLILLTARILTLLPPRPLGPPRNPKTQPAHILIVLGSGGHTAEMMLLLRDFDPYRYRYRTWVFSSGDGFSAERAREYERGVEERVKKEGRGEELGYMENGEGTGSERTVVNYRIVEVPRARSVHQSFLSTPLSALQCLWACIGVLQGRGYRSRGQKEYHAKQIYDYPNLIITNGPGTAVMVVLASYILRFLDLWNTGANKPGTMRTLFFESWARVKDVSLSGRLLVHLVDRFVVQWPALKGYGGRAEYSGWLVIDGGPGVQ
jgi:beta-1,4-N-acetylglucosaminyltransferase